MLEALDTASQIIAAACVASLIASVMASFAAHSRARKSVRVVRSPVEAGTITLFIVLFGALVWTQLGMLSVRSETWRGAVLVAGDLWMVAGAVLNAIGRLHLGGNWANAITLYEDQTLVTTGAYSVVRHPLYASLIWMLYGAALLCYNWLAALGLTAIFLPMMIYRARQEENLLIQSFPEYASYQVRVGMLFPRPRLGGRA